MFRGLPTASLRLADVLADPFTYTIPAYQRPYSWTPAEAGQLLEDIIEASGVDNTDTTEPDYFLGSILLLDIEGGGLPGDGPAMPPRLFDIVDGQQRLATITLMCAVLRDLEDDPASEIAQLMNRHIATAPRGGSERFRLTLRAPHQEFFNVYVQQPGACGVMPEEDLAGETEQLLLDVREHFLEELSNLDDEARARLGRYLVERCHVIVMLTRDIDRAHRMFIVLNGRGKPLGRQDILKAEVLRDVPEEAKAKAIAQWDEVATRLGIANFESFFSHLRVIHGHGDKPVISGMRAAISSSGGAETYLASVFEPMSRAYHQVLRAPLTLGALSGEIRRCLVYLGRLNGAEWVPCAMQALTQHAEHPERILQHLRHIDRFAHLQRLLCRGSGKRIRAFADVLEAMQAGRDLDAPDSPARLANDDVKTVHFNLRDLHGRNQQACKLVLLRINDELAGRLTEVDLGDYSVEHVAPQRPRALGAWQKGFPDAREREECTKSLGNLTLIGPKQNEKAKNQDFAHKKAIYADAKPEQVLAITQEVIASDDWTAAIVRERERRFLAALDTLWGIGIDPRTNGRAPAAPSANPARRGRPKPRKNNT